MATIMTDVIRISERVLAKWRQSGVDWSTMPVTDDLDEQCLIQRFFDLVDARMDVPDNSDRYWEIEAEIALIWGNIPESSDLAIEDDIDADLEYMDEFCPDSDNEDDFVLYGQKLS